MADEQVNEAICKERMDSIKAALDLQVKNLTTAIAAHSVLVDTNLIGVRHTLDRLDKTINNGLTGKVVEHENQIGNFQTTFRVVAMLIVAFISAAGYLFTQSVNNEKKIERVLERITALKEDIRDVQP